jgi:hypothetical protein
MKMEVCDTRNLKRMPPSFIERLKGRAVQPTKYVIRLDFGYLPSVPHILKVGFPV